MSKKKKRDKVPNVAAAMRAANQRGQYGSAIATKALIEQLGKATLAMHSGRMKSPKRKLSKTEKAARARVLAAYRASAARAARLPGKKKRRTKKKTASRAAAPAPARRRTSKKVRTVTANQVIAAQAQAALKRWLCEGARRSGCGAGGSRVVTGKGSFVRIRPPRFMTAG